MFIFSDTTIFSLLLLLSVIIFFKFQYISCKPNQVIDVYGITNDGSDIKFIRSGHIMVIPLIQQYGILSLEAVSDDINLENLHTSDNYSVQLDLSVVYSISEDETILRNATKHILHKSKEHIKEIVNDIVEGELLVTVSAGKYEEVNNTGKLISEIKNKIHEKLNEIGIQMISINIKNCTRV